MNHRPGGIGLRLGAGARKLGGVACLLLAGGAAAQTTVPPAPQRVEVQASPLGGADERRLALGLMTVVGRDELDAFGDTSVLDVLQRLPGVDLDGDQPRLRGLGGGYTLVLLNGEPAPPGFSLEQLAPGDIERIEVVRGPSVEHGGVAGTINVILRRPPRQRQVEARAQASHRSARPAGSTRLGWGDRVGALSFHLPLSAYQWAGANRSWLLRRSRGADLEPFEEQQTTQDHWHGGGVQLAPRADWKLSDDHTLQWQGHAQANDSGGGNRRQHQRLSGPPLAVVDEETQSSGHWRLLRQQVNGNIQGGDGLRLETRLGGQRSRWRQTVATLGLPGADGPQQRESRTAIDDSRHWVGAKLRWQASDAQQLVFGWEAERRSRRELRRSFEQGLERLTPSLGVPFDVSWSRRLLFVQDDWSLSPRAALSLGLRVEALRTEASAAGGPLRARAWVTSPMLQLRWALDASSRRLLRAGVSRSARLPDTGLLMARHVLNGSDDRSSPNTPLTPDSAGNPALQPERARALELAFEQHGADDEVLSVGAFHRQVDGLIRRRIALESGPDASVPRWVSRPVNLGQAWTAGLELEARAGAGRVVPALAGARSPLRLRAALSVYRSRVAQIDDPDARLEGQPPWQARLGAELPPQDSRPGFGVQASCTPAFWTQQTDLQRVWRSASRRVDLHLAGRGGPRLQWRLALQQAWPRDQASRQEVVDLDGFSATQAALRPVQRQWVASLVWRM